MRPADVALLRQTAVFRDLRPEAVEHITRGCFVQGLPKGAVLFSEGDKPEFCHVILTGRVGLFTGVGAGRDVAVEFFGPGDIFIAPAVILDVPYLMSAKLAMDSRILMVPAETFRRHLRQQPDFAFTYLQQLSQHWRLLVEQIKDLKLKSAPQRVAAYLIDGSKQKTGPATINLREERKLLAGRLGMTPESLSRSLARLRPLGVTSRGRQVLISDIDQLRQFCNTRDASPS